MNKFYLKLNKDKTQILVLAPPMVMKNIQIHGIFVDGDCIRFIDCTKNLGVWLDENFKHQVKKVVSSCFMLLKDLARIKRFIPKDHLSSLVASMIFSRLDYCNSLYYNIGCDEIKKLQSVQNAAVRLVCGGNKFDRQPISHHFTELHWLKVKERIIFKISITVHKCIWGCAPNSLMNKIVIANPRTFKLVEGKYNGQFGERAFSRAGPKIWNCLPLKIKVESDIDKFKKLLKSYLMIQSNDFYTSLNMT